MIIAGMVKSSLVDYPGKVSCVLFLPYCNYDCYFCHNRSLLDGTFTEIDRSDVFTFLEKRKGLLDAVVVTGGEPTLHRDLLPFLAQIKSLGYKIKLDTNGSAPNIVGEIISANLCDYYAVDYKAPKAKYKHICGKEADAEKVLTTINLLLKKEADFEVRTTVIPDLAEEDFFTMAKELPALPKYRLNRYRKPDCYLQQDAARVDKTPLTQEQIETLVQRLKQLQPNTAT